MMLVGPVTVFTLVSIWIAILLHTEVPQHGLRLVVQMSPQSLDQTSEAPVGRSTQGRTKATGVRVCVHHLCAEPGNVPGKPGRATRHCSVLIQTVPR